ncbi:hypothetical protein BJ878DRAFT_536715 [Calycina marina]|uniref:Uncharacterized protein n=1 Tax=Calycina marina TaxID=1763456 RepID=A0A9P8CBZ5_9HELO|nr:hypothetical protein BJ878DRAFT_536715 [Calycina marina]
MDIFVAERLSDSGLDLFSNPKKHPRSPGNDGGENPYAPSSVPADFSWYLKWLYLQVSKLPADEVSLFAKDADSGTTSLGENSTFHKTFLAINQIARSQDNLSIDEIQQKLIEEGIHLLDSDSFDVLRAQRRLVFAMLGWQSMLFLPAFDSRRSSSLNIYRAPGQPNSGLVFDDWSVSIGLTDRPLAILLKAFGNLLPDRSSSSDNVASELWKQAFSWTSLSPSDVNAYLLHTLLRLNIQWVDTLSLHLDYDKSTRSLSIFRHPSFCVAMLQSKGAIYSFASTESNPIDPRATSAEITNFLQETLLSYRLLFGQAKASRRFFKNMLKSEAVLFCNPDPLLRPLCLDQYFAHSIVPPDRTLYVTDRDFLVLGPRVEKLADDLKVTKPKSLIDILHDRRDTLQYWTFWFVVFIGGAGLLLGVLQVILATIQVLQASGKSI